MIGHRGSRRQHQAFGMVSQTLRRESPRPASATREAGRAIGKSRSRRGGAGEDRAPKGDELWSRKAVFDLPDVMARECRGKRRIRVSEVLLPTRFRDDPMHEWLGHAT